MSEISKRALAVASARPGKTTSEFKGKTAVQALFIFVLLLHRFGVDVQLDEQTALLMVAGLEAAYTFGRSIVKGFQARAVSDGSPVNLSGPTTSFQNDNQQSPATSKGT